MRWCVTGKTSSVGNQANFHDTTVLLFTSTRGFSKFRGGGWLALRTAVLSSGDTHETSSLCPTMITHFAVHGNRSLWEAPSILGICTARNPPFHRAMCSTWRKFVPESGKQSFLGSCRNPHTAAKGGTLMDFALQPTSFEIKVVVLLQSSCLSQTSNSNTKRTGLPSKKLW